MESGAPGAIRTHDRLLRRQMLYPTELQAHPAGKHLLACAWTKGKLELALWLQWGYNCIMSKTATIRTRIEPDLKTEVEDILAQLGLTASETVHLLYRQIKLQRGLPFDVRMPNPLTVRTLSSSKTGRNVKRFGSKKALFADLGL